MTRFSSLSSCYQELVTSFLKKPLQTPVYLYSEKQLQMNASCFQGFRERFGIQPYFAMKANSNPAIIRLFYSQGIFIDANSLGEIRMALKAGVTPGHILFSGVGKTREELKAAAELNIHAIKIESVGEAALLGKIAADLNQSVSVSLRLNPEIDPKTHPYISTGIRESKFGIDHQDLPAVIDILTKNPFLRLNGLSAHIGSQIFDVDLFIDVYRNLAGYASQFEMAGFTITELDLGGGFGIRYDASGETVADKMDSVFAELVALNQGRFKLAIEPGRMLVANSCILAGTVLYHKRNGDKHFLVTDASMTENIRPALYQAEHPIMVFTESEEGNPITADVVGPVCESGDFLGEQVKLMTATPGDFIGVFDSGAYTMSMASNYNLRPIAAEYLLSDGEWVSIRKRQTIEELINRGL